MPTYSTLCRLAGNTHTPYLYIYFFISREYRIQRCFFSTITVDDRMFSEEILQLFFLLVRYSYTSRLHSKGAISEDLSGSSARAHSLFVIYTFFPLGTAARGNTWFFRRQNTSNTYMLHSRIYIYIIWWYIHKCIYAHKCIVLHRP